MEGRGCYLKAHACQHKGQSNNQGGQRLPICSNRQGSGDLRQLRVPGKPIQQGHTKQQQGRGKTAHQKIFDGRFAAAGIAGAQGSQGINGQCHELKAQIKHNKIAR